MAGTLGIIAGLGSLPVQLAESACAQGRDVFILRLEGFAEPRLAGWPGETVGLGQVGHSVRLMKSAGCKQLVFAGIVGRPDFSKLKLDMAGVRLLPKVLQAARKGDDALLRTLLDYYRSQGFQIVGAHDVQAGLLASEGVMAGPVPGAAHMADIDIALRVAREVGRLDIGQGAVVCDGLVLAVEAQEGTDAMLRRCGQLSAHLRGTPRQRKGVLAKVPKPIQDRNIDLPTIGLSTLELADAAGLAGIALEAGGALILDRAGVLEDAERRGLFVFGAAPVPGTDGG